MTPTVFDVYRSLLKYVELDFSDRLSDSFNRIRHFETLQGSVISKLLDSISSGLQAAVEAIGRDLDAGERGQDSPHRTPLEIYAFLLQWFSTAAERRSSKDGTDFPAAITSKAKVESSQIYMIDRDYANIFHDYSRRERKGPNPASRRP